MLNNNTLSEIDCLATEYIQCLRRGDDISVEQFAAKYPEKSAAITKLFPAIASIESLRTASLDSPNHELEVRQIELQRLGDFRIVKEIGRGGMGIVFLAEQISLGRQIALKVLPPSFVAQPKYAQRFEREARIAANLHHTNIVPVFGVGRERDTLYIAMQFIDGLGLDQLIEHARSRPNRSCEMDLGKSLRAILKNSSTNQNELELKSEGVFDRDLSRCIADIGRQAANALQYAHEQGVLHRDVTPSNLLLDKSGNVWVADFGLASAIDYEIITEPGAVMGTVNYMAPEQYCHDGDARSDVYSLGMTLFELATLRRARNTKEFFKRVAENRPPQPRPSLRKLNTAIHRDLESIITRSIEANPNQRYQSARELATDFECFLNGEPIKIRRPNPIERLMRWGKTNPVAATASAIAVSLMVLITALSTFGYLRELNHREQTEALTVIATDALDEIYSQLAPRNLPQDLPAIRSGRSPVSSFDVVQMPSDETLAVLEKLQNHYERVSEFSYDTAIKLKTADAKNRMGQINIYLGKLAAAEHAFQDAAETCVQLLDSEKTRDKSVRDDAIVLLASTWNQLGYVYRGQFNDTLAPKAHDKAFDYLQSPSNKLANQTTYRFELARTLYSQDIYAREDASNPDLPSRTQQALQILNQLESNADDSEFQLLRARCYRRLSEKLSSLPNSNDRESIRIMRELVKRFPDIPQYKFELGYSLTGNQVVEIKNAAAYFERIQEALAIANNLVETSPDVPRYRQLAVLANEKHANYWRANNQPERAASYTEAAIKIQQGLLKRFPQLVAQHRVFLYALRLESTKLMIEQEEYERARIELDEITESVEELIRNPKLANDWHALRVLTASFDSLAWTATRLGKSRQATIARDKADHYRERFYEISS